MAKYQQKTFRTRDSLYLYYRNYPNDGSRLTPVLCLSGTAENSRVYEELAAHLATNRRVLCMDWRGRGRSDYDPDWQHYSDIEDRDDVLELLVTESIPKIVIVGTSLGGIIIMEIALYRPDVLAGAVMNDIGPVIASAGRQRLLSNSALPKDFTSFEVAASAMKERVGGGITLSDDEWLERVRRTYRGWAGRVVPDMDPMYSRVLSERKRPPDWWINWDAMKAIPVLVIRGAVSDVLDEATFVEMKRRKPDIVTAVVPGRGHYPHLDEPEALIAIDAFLE